MTLRPQPMEPRTHKLTRAVVALVLISIIVFVCNHVFRRGPETTAQAKSDAPAPAAADQTNHQLLTYKDPERTDVTYHFTVDKSTNKLVSVKVDRVGKHTTPMGQQTGPYSEVFEIRYVWHGEQEIPEAWAENHSFLRPDLEAQYYIQRYHATLEADRIANLPLWRRIFN